MRLTKTARGRIERGKHLLFDVHLALRQGIEQGRFARVCITYKRNYRQMFLNAALSSFVPLSAEIVHLFLKLSNAIADAAPVSFELSFTRSATTDTARQTRKGGILADYESRQEIFKLCQFDLELTLPAAGPLCENVKNKLWSVNYF